MKPLLAALALLFCSLPSYAQGAEWVTIKESPQQCYQDLKIAAFGATDFDDANRLLRGARWSTMGGDAYFAAQALSEAQWNPKKKKPNPNVCILVVALITSSSQLAPASSAIQPGPEPPSQSAMGLRSANTTVVWQIARSVKAQIEAAMKHRKKQEKNKKH
jgi:hypothetical protein